MERSDLKKEIVKVLEELFQGVKYSHPTSTHNSFPYDADNIQLALPNEIDYRHAYLKDFSAFSDNGDVYEFPEEEFKLGLRIEKDKNDTWSILDISEKVINKLKENPRFYSDLKD